VNPLRDVRELWKREGAGGVIGLALVFYWSLQWEYAIVRHGLRALRALLT